MAPSDNRLSLHSGAGSVTVVEHGGRVGELRPGPDLPNILWDGDVVAPVTGGDRFWLAPERELFYRGDPGLRSNWFCPEELDPGSWRLTAASGEVELAQNAMGTVMTRQVRPLDTAPLPLHLPWAGYEVTDRVVTDRPLSGWHLLMFPTPASVYVGHLDGVLEMFSPAPRPDHGWLDTGSDTEWKLGFAPPSDGRLVLACFGPADPGPALALITTTPPHGTYVDLPSQGPGPATAVQVYDSPGLGFCEIEHHFPLESRSAATTVLGVWGSRADRLDLITRIAALR